MTKPIHPGEILLKEFLIPNKLTQYRLAKDIGVQQSMINQIVNGKRSITPNTAVKLGKYFNNSPKFWLNLQNNYNLENL